MLIALDQGRLRGAILDVFDEEPLAAKHPLWLHPKVSVPPHMASEASNTAIVTQLLENTRRLAQGLALLHQI
ncbi:NAD(P)-dependent oxidoreductase [Agarivorans sp. QJM3NY_25]|uniref:NAD(P)-dependent oxidoreductase n=1 Tax=Agarivorans sp. QJM3NY_25 TaxID=3421430 RepID=UPI003D7E09D8